MYRIDPRDRAHLEAAEREPAHAAALRRHFEAQRASFRALNPVRVPKARETPADETFAQPKAEPGI
jgi:hypothetical protein